MNQPDDKMTLTILEDGTARIEVDGISGANHIKADMLVTEMAKLMGGELTVETRPEKHGHMHHHHGTRHRHEH